MAAEWTRTVLDPLPSSLDQILGAARSLVAGLCFGWSFPSFQQFVLVTAVIRSQFCGSQLLTERSVRTSRLVLCTLGGHASGDFRLLVLAWGYALHTLPSCHQCVQPSLLSNFFSILFSLIPQPLQVPDSSVPHVPPSSCFPTLLQTAYESHTLGDKSVQTQLLAAIPCLALQHMVRSAKQVLLYLRSTVENFGQVSALLFLPALRLQSVLIMHHQADPSSGTWALGSAAPSLGPVLKQPC